LDPIDLSLVHLKLSGVAVSAMAKLSCNISTNKIEKLVSNSDSEEQCISNVSDIECAYDLSEYNSDIATNKARHKGKSKNRDTAGEISGSHSSEYEDDLSSGMLRHVVL
jgi:hypothetical protein